MCVCVCGKRLCTQTSRVIDQNFPWVGEDRPSHCLLEVSRTAFVLALPIKPFLVQGHVPCLDELSIV